MTRNEGWFEPVRERLVLRRHQLGLPQKAVAEAAGMDPAVLCLLEGAYRRKNKQRQPGPIVLARWAHALRVDTELTLRLHAAEWPDDLVIDMMDSKHF